MAGHENGSEFLLFFPSSHVMCENQLGHNNMFYTPAQKITPICMVENQILFIKTRKSIGKNRNHHQPLIVNV